MTEPATDSATSELDPDLAILLEELNRRAPMASTSTTAHDMRAGFGDLMALLHPAEPPVFDGGIHDAVVGPDELPVRIYQPETARDFSKVLVFAHGGGWVVGMLDSADPHVRRISESLGVPVVSIDYRLSPEHPFPTPLDDVETVHEWVQRTLAPDWIGLAGDSAGANLAAAAALDAQTRGLQCDAQLLFYPALDPTMSSRSHRELASGYLLDHPTIEFYWRCYLDGLPRDPDGRIRELDARVNPSLATDAAVASLPPTVLTTSGFDPLQDEGGSYAERLRSTGVTIRRVHQPGLIHGWVDQCDVLPAAAAALDEVLETFRDVALG